MGACKCNTGLINTGRGNCEPVMRVAVGLFMVQTYDASNIRNHIDLSVPLDDALLTSKVNEPDKTKRWYPIMGLENVAIADADSVFSETGKGGKYFVRNGKRSVTAEIWNYNETYIGRLRGNRCPQMSVFIIDSEGKISGIFRGADESKLYPFDIERGSFDAKITPATDSTVSVGMITFDFTDTDISNMDDIRVLTEDTATANLLGAEGLVDVAVKVVSGSITATGFDFDCCTENGGTKKIPLSGLALSDVLLQELPALTNLATAIAESPTVAGRYSIAYASNPTSNLRLTIAKQRFDFNRLNVTTP